MVGLSITWAPETASLRIDRVRERDDRTSQSLVPQCSGQDPDAVQPLKCQISFEIADTAPAYIFSVVRLRRVTAFLLLPHSPSYPALNSLLLAL